MKITNIETNNVIFSNHNQEKSKKEEAPKKEAVLSPPIVELIEKYQTEILSKGKGEIATIHVDEIASKIAQFYEKVRKVIDWKEENVLRRSAILRILKRSYISKISSITFSFSKDAHQTSETLILELIRGGHLPNDEIPVPKIDIVANVLKKYIYILENAPFVQNNTEFLFKKKINFFNWLFEIAACEIEDILACPFKENALIKAMTLLMSERIKVVPNSLTEPHQRTLTYIAVCRTLFDLDDPIIIYHILKYRYPEWMNPSGQFLVGATRNIFKVADEMEKELTHPFSRDFFNICERTDTVFTLLGDFLDYYKKDPTKINEVIADKNQYKELITQFYNKRLKTLKTRLFRLAIFSTLSVFVSNSFTYFLIEIPLAHIFYEGFNLLAAIVDFIVPSIAMFVLVAIIKPPGKGNLEKAIEVSFKFIYAESDIEIYEIKPKKKIGFVFGLIITLLYITASIISFGAVALVFYIANLPKTSVVFDTMTIAINVFAALIIRNKARELTVQEKTTLGEFVLDFLSIPVAQVGNFLSRKWKEYNVITVFFNYFIEMPFVTFVEFIESWSQFLKEKKADIH